jgi:ParB-like nuclease domain
MKHCTDAALTGRGTRRNVAAKLPAGPAHPATPRHAQTASAPRGLKGKIAWLAIDDLKPFPGNPRQHPEAQIARLMRSIDQVWTNPLLVEETGTILAGHGRLEAAKRLGRTEVPTLTIAGLSAAEKRAVAIADNRLPEQAVWDFDILRRGFKELIEVDFDVELTGFSTGEIDLLLDGKPGPATADPTDDLTGLRSDGPAISQPGPERASPEAIDELKREIGSRVFAAQYQQNPTPPDGNMIKAAWLGRYDQVPDCNSFQRVVLSCDPAGKADAHNDYTAITIVGAQKQALHLLHVIPT